MEHGTLVVERRKKLGFMRVLAVPKLVPRIGIAEQTCNNGTRPCFTITFLGLTKESHFEKLVSPLRVVPLSRALSHFTRHAHATRASRKLAHPPAILTPVLAKKIGNKKPRRSGVGWVGLVGLDFSTFEFINRVD